MLSYGNSNDPILFGKLFDMFIGTLILKEKNCDIQYDDCGMDGELLNNVFSFNFHWHSKH